MSLVLNIDTTSEAALANIAENGVVLLEERNEIQNNHAAFLHPALQSLLHKTGKALKDIDAVAVSHGPGSYTGIRVGTAAAKGLCYAAGKPLIVVGQLELLAQDAIANSSLSRALYCPMIDARRMEVFAAVYNSSLKEIMPAAALVLDENSFDVYLKAGKMVFSGSGATKWKQLAKAENALFVETINKGLAFALLSHKKFIDKQFANLAYAAPLYVKPFYPGANAR